MYRDNRIAVILTAAGLGMRMGSDIPKQYLKIGNEMVLEKSLEVFEKHPFIDDIFLVVSKNYMDFCYTTFGKNGKHQKLMGIISGGDNRQESVYNGLKVIDRAISDSNISTPDYIVIHDGVRPFVSACELDRLIESVVTQGAASLAVPPKDSVVRAENMFIKENLNRNELYLIQTPQAFQFQMILAAHRNARSEGYTGTDDTVLVRRMGNNVALVEGSYENIKITTNDDMKSAGEIIKGGQDRQVNDSSAKTDAVIRTGNGFDVHAFGARRELVLGGVKMRSIQGLLGHSDADVLVHAIIDALLGACGLGDIGIHFPDSNDIYKGASSLDLLSQANEIVKNEGFGIGNIDSIVIAQRPKISPYIGEMKSNIAKALDVDKEKINIKGTTTEGLGFCGREEGIAAMASAAIYRM